MAGRMLLEIVLSLIPPPPAKLVEIAYAADTVQDRRIYIGRIRVANPVNIRRQNLTDTSEPTVRPMTRERQKR